MAALLGMSIVHCRELPDRHVEDIPLVAAAAAAAVVGKVVALVVADRCSSAKTV